MKNLEQFFDIIVVGAGKHAASRAADRRAETRRSLSSRKGAPAAAGSPCFKTRFGAEQGNLPPPPSATGPVSMSISNGS